MKSQARSSFAIALLLILAAPVHCVAAAPPAQVFIDGAELHYVGSLSEEANRQAFALFDSAPDKPATLSIRSKGGPTGAGMDLGRWVHAKGLTVKVMELCFSSCANYVFTAAPRKIVSNFAVVGYHGGLSSVSFRFDDKQEAMLEAMPPEQRQLQRAKLMEALRQEIAPQVEAERKFFSSIGVQQRITTLGQGREKEDDDKSLGWTYSVADFSTLGVNQIRVINPPWKPALIHSDATVTLLSASPAPAKDGGAPPDARTARYDATCAFIVDEVQRLDRLLGQGMGNDVLEKVIPESGASLFRREAEDLRIDYLITAGGKTIVDRAELGPKQLGKRLTASALRNKLGLRQDLPPSWRTGCEGLALRVTRKGNKITAMTIEADIEW